MGSAWVRRVPDCNSGDVQAAIGCTNQGLALMEMFLLQAAANSLADVLITNRGSMVGLVRICYSEVGLCRYEKCGEFGCECMYERVAKKWEGRRLQYRKDSVDAHR